MDIVLFTTGLIMILITIYDMIATILDPRSIGLIADGVSRASEDEPKNPEKPYLERISEISSIRGRENGEGRIKRRKLLLAHPQNNG